MLLAVEGGGFFSSSASGYSKGLTLLLLGRSNEDRPMRVSPWNQFQLLEQNDTDLQLASNKNRRSRGCASFICFGRSSSAGLDCPSPPKVGPVHGLQDPSSGSDKGQVFVTDGDGDQNGLKVVCLKSSLKKKLDGSDDDYDDAPGCVERRKVQWTDACGRELVEIREFEVSEAGASDDEFDGDGNRGCSCWIQ